VSTESLLPNCRIRCTLALKYDNVEQIRNRQTLQRHPAAARRLDSPNGCREQHVHSNTSLVWIMPKTPSKYVEHSSWDALSVATHLVTSDIDDMYVCHDQALISASHKSTANCTLYKTCRPTVQHSFWGVPSSKCRRWEIQTHC